MAEIIKLLGLIMVMIGIILIYDARYIAKKWFTTSDQNEATLTLKLMGFFISIIIGSIIFI